MKTKIYIVFALSIILASCTSLQQTSVNDDLYFSPKDEVVATNDVNVVIASEKAKYTKSDNIYDDQINEILADESIENIDTVIYEDTLYENSYYDIVVRDRDDAYQRRLEGFENPYYGMNYGAVYLSDAYWYASSYDPYFYNIIIMGDQVWVEPRWMTSSFGYWPRNSFYSPYYYPYYSSFYGYYDPFYYSYYSPYSYHHPYYHHHHHYGYSGYSSNYVSSSFNSYRQRSLASRWSAGSTNVGRTSRSRDLPETHTGRNVTRASTVKTGLDRQGGRTTERVGTRTNRGEGGTVTTRTAVSRNRVSTSTANRTYTRPSSTNRSTYSTSSRPTTRYNRPASSNVSSGRSTSTRSTSTYSPARSGNTRSSGSTYTPNTSTRSSGSTTTRSSSTRSSSGSSGSVRSSGSSSRSSGSSSRSSGSSSRSSSGSSSRSRR